MNQFESIRLRTAALLTKAGLAQPFTWRGRTLHGVRTALRREDVAMDAGLAEAYEFSILVAPDEFSNLSRPEPRRDCVEVDGRRLRVLGVEELPLGACIRLNLGGEYA